MSHNPSSPYVIPYLDQEIGPRPFTFEVSGRNKSELDTGSTL